MNIRSLLFLPVVFVVLSSGADTLTWNGGAAGTWDATSDNWLSQGGTATVWTDGADAVIPAAAEITLAADVEVGKLTVAEGISGAVTLSGGQMTVFEIDAKSPTRIDSDVLSTSDLVLRGGTLSAADVAAASDVESCRFLDLGGRVGAYGAISMYGGVGLTGSGRLVVVESVSNGLPYSSPDLYVGSSSVKVFEGMNLADIDVSALVCDLGGGWMGGDHSIAVPACNVKTDGDAKIAQFQVVRGDQIWWVKVQFAQNGADVYAKVVQTGLHKPVSDLGFDVDANQTNVSDNGTDKNEVYGDTRVCVAYGPRNLAAQLVHALSKWEPRTAAVAVDGAFFTSDGGRTQLNAPITGAGALVVSKFAGDSLIHRRDGVRLTETVFEGRIPFGASNAVVAFRDTSIADLDLSTLICTIGGIYNQPEGDGYPYCIKTVSATQKSCFFQYSIGNRPRYSKVVFEQSGVDIVCYVEYAGMATQGDPLGVDPEEVDGEGQYIDRYRSYLELSENDRCTAKNLRQIVVKYTESDCASGSETTLLEGDIPGPSAEPVTVFYNTRIADVELGTLVAMIGGSWNEPAGEALPYCIKTVSDTEKTCVFQYLLYNAPRYVKVSFRQSGDDVVCQAVYTGSGGNGRALGFDPDALDEGDRGIYSYGLGKAFNLRQVNLRAGVLAGFATSEPQVAFRNMDIDEIDFNNVCAWMCGEWVPTPGRAAAWRIARDPATRNVTLRFDYSPQYDNYKGYTCGVAVEFAQSGADVTVRALGCYVENTWNCDYGRDWSGSSAQTPATYRNGSRAGVCRIDLDPGLGTTMRLSSSGLQSTYTGGTYVNEDTFVRYTLGVSPYTSVLKVGPGAVLQFGNEGGAQIGGASDLEVAPGGELQWMYCDNSGFGRRIAVDAGTVTMLTRRDNGDSGVEIGDLTLLNGCTVASNGSAETGDSAIRMGYRTAARLTVAGTEPSLILSGVALRAPKDASTEACVTFDVADVDEGDAADLLVSSCIHDYNNDPASATTLKKTGAGTLSISVPATFTGTLEIDAGIVSLDVEDALPSAQVALGGGTLSLGGHAQTLAALALTDGASTLDLADGTAAFADSSGVEWTGTLSVVGDISAKPVRFGTDASGLTSAQMHRIRCGGRRVMLDADGYLVIQPSGFTVLVR